MEQRHPHALPTHVAIWITIVAPFTKVALSPSSLPVMHSPCICMLKQGAVLGAQYALVLTPFAAAIEAGVLAGCSSQSRKLLSEQEDWRQPAGRCACGRCFASWGMRGALR